MFGSKQFGFEAAVANRPVLKHIAKLQSEIIAFLRERRGFHALSELERALEFSSGSYPNLTQVLSSNPKVYSESQDGVFMLRYRATFDQVGNQQDLCRFVEKNPNGVVVDDLEDAYDGILDDIETLISEGVFFKLENADSNKANVYFHDSSFDVSIDPDIVELWSNVKVPDNETEVTKQLSQAGMIEASDTIPGLKRKKKIEQERAKKQNASRRNRFMRVTNVHMIESLPWLKDTQK